MSVSYGITKKKTLASLKFVMSLRLYLNDKEKQLECKRHNYFLWQELNINHASKGITWLSIHAVFWFRACLLFSLIANLCCQHHEPTPTENKPDVSYYRL